jgi:hypothetical protein
MPLKMQGTVKVDALRAEIWNQLFDTQFLMLVLNKIPGIHVEKLDLVSPDKYEGTMTMGVAMIKGKYDGTITVLEKRAPEYVKFHGEGKGGGDWTSGDMALTLVEQEGQTLMTYEGTGSVSGKMASVGQRLIDTVGKHFVQHGTKALAEEMAARTHANEAAPSNPAKATKPISAMPPDRDSPPPGTGMGG